MESLNQYQSRKNSRRNRKREGYLTIRLRRMVKEVVTQKKKPETKVQNLVTRIILTLVYLICLSLFAYETYDRIDYFFKYPVDVDVFIKESKAQQLPALTVCYQETEDVAKLFNKIPPEFSCGIHFTIFIMMYYPGYNASHIWQMANTTTALKSALYVTRANAANLLISEVYLPWGICTTFKLDNMNLIDDRDTGQFEVKFGLYKGYCHYAARMLVFLHDPDDHPMSGRWAYQPIGKKIEARSTNKEVRFVNVTRNPCISNKRYSKCQENCFNEFVKKLGIDCWYPLHAKELNQTVCTSDSNSAASKLIYMTDYLTGENVKRCSCIRRCRNRMYDFMLQALESYTNQSFVISRQRESHYTIIRERLSYDIINLLCDVGGCSGLTIGLSLLSIFHLIDTLIMSRARKTSSSEFKLEDPLLRIVSRTFHRWFRKLENKQQRPFLCIIVWKFVGYVVCVGMLAFCIANRTSHFLSYPVSKLVDVKFIDLFENRPTFIVCSGDSRIMELQKIIANDLKFQDSCNVDLWDLLDIPLVNATYVWTNNKTESNGITVVSYNPVTLFTGTCHKYEAVPASTSAGAIWQYNIELFRSTCGTSYQKMYIIPETGNINYYYYRYLPVDFVNDVFLTIKKINIPESLRQTCVTEYENEMCMLDCIQRILFAKIKCRLPYMPTTTLPMCNSSSSAKQSHLIFMGLFLTPNDPKDCICPPKCITIVYDSIVLNGNYNGLKVLNYTVLSFGLSNSFIVTFREQYSYSFIKFLSDVGGLAGSMLGLCILSTFEAVLSLANNHFLKKKQSL